MTTNDTEQALRRVLRRGDLYSVSGYEPGQEPLFNEYEAAKEWAAEVNLEDLVQPFLEKATGLHVIRDCDMSGVRWYVDLPDRDDGMTRYLVIGENDCDSTTRTDDDRMFRSWGANTECFLEEEGPSCQYSYFGFTVETIRTDDVKSDPRGAARKIGLGVGEFLWQLGVIDHVGIEPEPGEE